MSLDVRVALMLLYRSVESLRLLWGEGIARGEELGILTVKKEKD